MAVTPFRNTGFDREELSGAGVFSSDGGNGFDHVFRSNARRLACPIAPNGISAIIAHVPQTEGTDMIQTSIVKRLGLIAAAGLIALSFSTAPTFAAGTPEPPPPSGDKDKKGKMTDEQFLDGYRQARAMILDGKYEQGIAAMHALQQDQHPDVANYVGYAYRKLGRYEDSKLWYEAALKSDPNHARTWSYYGMWHAEQGNRLKAEDYLQKVKLICGNESCTEFTQLREVIDGKATY